MAMQQKDNAIRSANRTIQELDGKAFGDGLYALSGLMIIVK